MNLLFNTSHGCRILWLMFVSLGANAAILYDNGPTNDVTAYSIGGGFISADDFVLDNRSEISSIRFLAIGQAAEPIQSVRYSIYSDAGSHPGVVLHSGLSANLQSEPAGSYFNGWEWFRFAVSLQTEPILLDAGTYWLALHAVVANNSSPTYWGTTNDRLQTAPVEQGITWHDPVFYLPGNGLGRDLSFSVEGSLAPVPEPASLLFVVAGLAFGVRARGRMRNC